MGVLSRVHGLRRFAGTPDALDNFWYAPPGWASTFSQTGIRVTPELALTVSAVWFGATFLARNLGSLQCNIYQHAGPKSRQLAPDHPLFPVVSLQPNATQDAFQWVEQGVGHLALRGNWYSRILSGARGFVDQLVPLHPDLIKVGRLPTGRLQYIVRNLQGQPPEVLTQDEVFHVRGYSTDGITGLSVIAYGANSMGTAIAQDTYVARFFKQGASASLAVKHPGTLGEMAAVNLRKSINAYLTGLENVGGVLVLEENATLDKIGITPEDAQLLGMRDHSIREVARWFGLPSYLFSDLAKPPTYASSVQFAEDLVRYSFRPLARRIELAMRTQLILQPGQFSSEFDMAALLRGDPASRAAYYHAGILDGWMNRNEAREGEDLNPAVGLDDFLEPQNMRDAGTPPSSPSTGPMGVRATLLALEASTRVVRKEIAAATHAATKYASDPVGWSGWLRTFYADHAAFVSTTLKVPLSLARSYAAHQGAQLERVGLRVTEDWEATAVPRLASWALEGENADGRLPTILEVAPRIAIDVAAPLPAAPAAVHVAGATVQIDAPVTVQAPPAAHVQVDVHVPKPGPKTKRVGRNAGGQITTITETEDA